MSPEAMEAATHTPEQEAQELTDMFVDQGDQLPTPPSIQQQHMHAAIELSNNVDEATGDDGTADEHVIFQDTPEVGLATEQHNSGKGGLITPKPKEVAAPPAVEVASPQDATTKRNILEVHTEKCPTGDLPVTKEDIPHAIKLNANVNGHAAKRGRHRN